MGDTRLVPEAQPHRMYGRALQNKFRAAQQPQTNLLEFGFGASFFQLLLGCLGVGLGHGLLNSLGCTIDQILGFLQT